MGLGAADSQRLIKYNKAHLGENIKNRIGPKGSILFFEKNGTEKGTETEKGNGKRKRKTGKN